MIIVSIEAYIFTQTTAREVVALMIDIPDIGQDPLDFVLTMGVRCSLLAGIII